MKRIFGYFLLITMSMIFLSCNTLQSQSTKTNLYVGQKLKIGIIGEIPKVREEQIKFARIQFSDLEKSEFDSRYDAIFIAKNNLSEASEEKYKPIYKKSKISFFFIQSKKSYVPFIQEGLLYEKAPDMPNQTYATGILYNGDNLKYWEYGLHNDIESQENVKELYSRIFETISQHM